MPVEINNTPKGNESVNKNSNNVKTDSILKNSDKTVANSDMHSPQVASGITYETSDKDYSNNPNSITVSISDKTTPIVVLYGPPQCGKTMTLVRLTRFLKDKGFQVVPDKTFRDSQDKGYNLLCENFNDIISSNDAADSTAAISFMLVKILHKGHPVCQILEAPGEHYFNLGKSSNSYPPYISRIMNSNNRKIWAIMLEPNWENEEIRRGYVDNIKYLFRKLNGKGKFLFVYNKIDMSNALTKSDTIKEVADTFPGIFEPFRNMNPISRFWKKYNCDVVRFTTGDYAKVLGGGQTYTPSEDSYPSALWNSLLKYIRG